MFYRYVTRRKPRRRRGYGRFCLRSRRYRRYFARRPRYMRRRLGRRFKFRWSDMANNRSGPFFYPHKLNVKFHYHYEIGLFNGGVEFWANDVVRTFNAYGPVQGDANQPCGWSQLNTIYDKYEVIGCKVRVVFRWNKFDNEIEQNSVIVYCTRDNDGVYYSTKQRDFYEKAVTNTKWKKLKYGKQNYVIITMYCSVLEFVSD